MYYVNFKIVGKATAQKEMSKGCYKHPFPFSRPYYGPSSALNWIRVCNRINELVIR